MLALRTLFPYLCLLGTCAAQDDGDEMQLQVCGQRLQQFTSGQDVLIRTSNNLCATNEGDARIVLRSCNSSLATQKWQYSDYTLSQGSYCWTSQSAQPEVVYPSASIKLFPCPVRRTWNTTFTMLRSTIIANFTSATSANTSSLCVGSFHMYKPLLTPGTVSFGKLPQRGWFTARTDMLDSTSYRMYVWNWWGPYFTPGLQLYTFISSSGECEDSLTVARTQGPPPGTVSASNNFLEEGSSPEKYEMAQLVPGPAERVCMGVYCSTSSGCTVEIRFEIWPNRSQPIVGPRIPRALAPPASSTSSRSMSSGELAAAIIFGFFGSLCVLVVVCGAFHAHFVSDTDSGSTPPVHRAPAVVGVSTGQAFLDLNAFSSGPPHASQQALDQYRAAPSLQAARQAALHRYDPHSLGPIHTSIPAATPERECSVCLSSEKDTVLGCGHCYCSACAYRVRECPACRKPVTKRIRVQLFVSTPASAESNKDPALQAVPVVPPGMNAPVSIPTGEARVRERGPVRPSSIRSCPLCADNKADTALGCGHAFCSACLNGAMGFGTLRACPTCLALATVRIKIFQ